MNSQSNLAFARPMMEHITADFSDAEADIGKLALASPSFGPARDLRRQEALERADRFRVALAMLAEHLSWSNAFTQKQQDDRVKGLLSACRASRGEPSIFNAAIERLTMSCGMSDRVTFKPDALSAASITRQGRSGIVIAVGDPRAPNGQRVAVSFGANDVAEDVRVEDLDLVQSYSRPNS
jgi:hypothetical protein